MSNDTYRKALFHFLWYIFGAFAAGGGIVAVKVLSLSQVQTLILGIGIGALSIIAVIVIENKLAR